MDRCRCSDYEEAVRKLKFFTMGTLRPDIIDRYDSTGYAVSWFKIGISHDDMKFLRPRARKVLNWAERPENRLSPAARKIEQMWCPFMTPHVEPASADDKNMYNPKEDEEKLSQK